MKASHLTPLDHDDIIGRKGRNQPWNPIASDPYKGDGASDHHDNTTTTLDEPLATPHNAQDFMKKWRKIKASTEKQYQ